MKSVEVEPGIWYDQSDKEEFIGYSTNDFLKHQTIEQAREHRKTLVGTEFEVRK